jgi:hypothetical protein
MAFAHLALLVAILSPNAFTLAILLDVNSAGVHFFILL